MVRLQFEKKGQAIKRRFQGDDCGDHRDGGRRSARCLAERAVGAKDAPLAADTRDASSQVIVVDSECETNDKSGGDGNAMQMFLRDVYRRLIVCGVLNVARFNWPTAALLRATRRRDDDKADFRSAPIAKRRLLSSSEASFLNIPLPRSRQASTISRQSKIEIRRAPLSSVESKRARLRRRYANVPVLRWRDPELRHAARPGQILVVNSA